MDNTLPFVMKKYEYNGLYYDVSFNNWCPFISAFNYGRYDANIGVAKRKTADDEVEQCWKEYNVSVWEYDYDHTSGLVDSLIESAIILHEEFLLKNNDSHNNNPDVVTEKELMKNSMDQHIDNFKKRNGIQKIY